MHRMENSSIGWRSVGHIYHCNERLVSGFNELKPPSKRITIAVRHL